LGERGLSFRIFLDAFSPPSRDPSAARLRIISAACADRARPRRGLGEVASKAREIAPARAGDHLHGSYPLKIEQLAIPS
jgi:hypothetical protein